LQYSGNTEKVLPILAIPIQYCNINNPATVLELLRGRLLHVRPVLPKSKLLATVEAELLQDVCPSCHPSNITEG